jgi:uncharacterized protein (DUF1800 family)
MADITKHDPAWAWQAYEPSAENPWNLRKVGHLYRRAGFGANWSELQQGLKDGPAKTIDRVLKPSPGLEAHDKQLEQMARHVVAQGDETQLRAWWLFAVLTSPFPLREKMTLCWHNHFATSNAKVNSLRFMLGQNELMRRHALGNFAKMLQEMSKDPAMMVWLDTNLSKKGQPNENYSRELMELFSLGIGNYTEDDVREGARAFTGWELKNGQFHFNRSQHDAGEKNYLGRKGKFGGEDIVKVCLEQPACSTFVTGKFYRQFISENEPPTRELLAPLAARFRDSGYDIAGIVSTMIRSNLFFSEHAYRARVKSPTDFAVGIVRALEGRMGTIALAQALENLGQKLFAPPSVKGWDGGPAWINSTTLLHRQNLALALTSTEDNRFGRRIDPAVLAKKNGKEDDEEVVEFFVQLFLQGDLSADARANLSDYQKKSRSTPYPVFWTKNDMVEHRVRALCHLVLSQPEFQLD